MNIMKSSLCRIAKRLRAPGWLLASLLFAGCGHLYYADPNPTSPYVFPGQSSTPPAMAQTPSVQPGPALVSSNPAFVPGAASSASGPSANAFAEDLRIGDAVTVSFSDIPAPGILPITQRIGNDGQISLPYNVKVTAAGKTAAQLQEAIRSAYVPAIYIHMTASVASEERVFFVEGEIKTPGRLPYKGQMTVLRAITSAGSFTDFANRKKIELRRATGEKLFINWFKANEDPKLDLPVFPNDLLIIRKKGAFGL